MSRTTWDRAWAAYTRARNADRTPSDETRRVACGSACAAYMYAKHIDRAARDDTREAACREPATAYIYALYVDGHPTPETRAAVSIDPHLADAYAVAFGERAPHVCRRCGCADDRARTGGCWWVEEDLCSACAPAVLALPKPVRGTVFIDVTKTSLGSRVVRGFQPAEEE